MSCKITSDSKIKSESVDKLFFERGSQWSDFEYHPKTIKNSKSVHKIIAEIPVSLFHPDASLATVATVEVENKK